MPILESPVDLIKHPVTHGYWVDESNNPSYRGFYDAFAGHHPGVDFSVPEGTPIKAAIPGIVIRQESHPGMGNTLAIRLGNVYSLYSHLSEFCVELGQLLRPKQLLAYSGNTGSATTGPHLHFELRDLSISSLKDSVFEPVFGKELARYQPTFTHIINDSSNTLVSLSLRYFGQPSFASLIRDNNPQFTAYSFDTPLPQNQSVLIPMAPAHFVKKDS